MWYNGGMNIGLIVLSSSAIVSAIVANIGLIVIASFFLAGGGLLLHGERRKEPRRLKFRIGLALLLAAGIALFMRDAELRGILTAAAVVIAV
ncbi:unnamed protein product, partial [marine sediment metagenome]